MLDKVAPSAGRGYKNDVLLQRFLETAQRQPDKLAIRDIRREATFSQLIALSATMKRFIEAETPRPNVGILLPSTAGFAASFYGGLWAGKTIVPLNFLLPPAELAGIVADAGLDLILTCEYFKDLAAALPARSIILERAGLRRRYLLSKVRPRPAVPDAGADDLAVILYTSGTTGTPRGVCLTHGNLYTDAFASIEHFCIDANEQFLGIIPLFHSFGLTGTLLLPTLLGATVHFQARFQPADVVQAVARDRISVFLAVPSMLVAIARDKTVPADTFQGVRLPICGGEPLSPELWSEYRDRFGIELLEGYGLTETSPVVAANVPGANRPGTVGRALSVVETCVRDELGNALPSGQAGELCFRGPTIMQGYYNRPADTAAAIDVDGWFRSGDIGRLDADGFITITGRCKDLIIVAGENVFPGEIERVLDRHPAVEQSAVIGTGDGVRGESIVAFVVPREGTAPTAIELRDYCRDHLAGFKVPRRIFFDRDLPKGPTGKLLKRQLRQRLAEGVSE